MISTAVMLIGSLVVIYLFMRLTIVILRIADYFKENVVARF